MNMKALLKCRVQNLAILVSFILGVLLTLSISRIEKKCESPVPRYGHSHKKIKPGNYDLIILVISGPTNGDRRQVIRETWLQYQDKIQYDAEIYNFKMKHYFVIGSVQLNADTILHLSTEQSVNNDLLFLNLKDEYSALTQKVLNSFIWLNEQHSNQNFNYSYMMKTDDDTFIRLDSLAKEISTMRELPKKQTRKSVDVIIDKLEANSAELRHVDGNNKHLYWGYFNGNANVKTDGKWKDNEWMLCNKYIPYALGGGYILSRSLVTYIAQNADYLRIFKSEDVSVGLWLAPVANIQRKHDLRFDTEWTSRGCKNSYLVTHKHSIDKMRKLFKQVETTGNLCETEYTDRPSYEYNWNVLPGQCCVRDSSLP